MFFVKLESGDPQDLKYGVFRITLSLLRMLAGPYQHLKEAILHAWRSRAAAILSSRKGFRERGEGGERCGHRPGLPSLRMLAGPYPHFKAAIRDAWRARAAAILTTRKGFRCGPLSDVVDSVQLLFSSHLRERDKMLLSSILCGGVWILT